MLYADNEHELANMTLTGVYGNTTVNITESMIVNFMRPDSCINLSYNNEMIKPELNELLECPYNKCVEERCLYKSQSQ